MRESFVLYTKYEEQVGLLTDTQAGILLRSLLCYQSEKPLPKMDTVTYMTFSFIRQDIDAEHKRKEEINAVNRANGKLGGRPPKSLINKGDKPKKPNGFENNQAVLEKTEKTERFIKETTPLTKESSKENNTLVQEIPPFFISPHGEEEKTQEELFFEKYPRYAKDRAKMRADVDYKRLIEEFEKSTYLRSLYTVKQINENYPLIVAGDFRDKPKTNGQEEGREYMAKRDRWYTGKRIQAEKRAEEVYSRFMLSEEFRKIEKRLKELLPEMARLEVDVGNGNTTARGKLVKLEQERGRLQQQKTAIIERNGVDEEDFKPKYDCAKCNDTGFKKDGTLCDCYLED